MAVTITRNFGPLANIPLTSKALMREVGLLARERIIRRTLSGRDQNDAPFHPYSPEYRATKAKELGGGGTVNLQVSGRMLQGLVLSEITETSVTLEFKD